MLIITLIPFSQGGCGTAADLHDGGRVRDGAKVLPAEHGPPLRRGLCGRRVEAPARPQDQGAVRHLRRRLGGVRAPDPGRGEGALHLQRLLSLVQTLQHARQPRAGTDV